MNVVSIFGRCCIDTYCSDTLDVWNAAMGLWILLMDVYRYLYRFVWIFMLDTCIVITWIYLMDAACRYLYELPAWMVALDAGSGATWITADYCMNAVY
jgi:hypothetical protein